MPYTSRDPLTWTPDPDLGTGGSVAAGAYTLVMLVDRSPAQVAEASARGSWHVDARHAVVVTPAGGSPRIVCVESDRAAAGAAYWTARATLLAIGPDAIAGEASS
ncbi:MAG TPA: hypothetical protein VFH61_08455 [Thermoleophilia bacterium]|nr:hypothetical protein [Thermoleophilia bacterium]